MRKLNTKDYKIGDAIYNVKESMADILMSPKLQLKAADLINNNCVGSKILNSDDILLLEESEYKTLLNATNTLDGFSRNDVELVERIINCEQVEVKEA